MKKILALVFVFGFLFPVFSFADFEISLKRGSQGKAVVELQDLLQDQGHYTGKIDGKFGLGTLKAVKAFQLANGLVVDGYFGLASRTKAAAIVADLTKDSDDAEQAETGSISIIYSIEGCTATSLFSVLSGLPCNSTIQPIADLPSGCLSLSGYSVSTGLKCDGLTQAKIDALNAQIQALNQTLDTIANNVAPAPIMTPPALTPEPLVFTQKPKIFYKNLGTVQNPEYRLSYITWETNRPSRIIGGPVIQDVSGWTTAQGAGDSCGGGSLTPYSATICKITAEDFAGVKAEVFVSLKEDILFLPF